MAKGRFAAQVAEFERKTLAKLLRIIRIAAQDVFADAQKPVGEGGRMPVDTGFLRNTAQSGLNGFTIGEGPDAYVLSLAQMNIGDTVYIVWTAEYARHVEYGTTRMPARFFMRGAAQKWQMFVNQAARKVMNE